MKTLAHCFLLLMAINLLALPQTARGQAPDDAPQVRILHPDAAPEIVWSHATQACDATDYSDVPARPFLGDGGRRVFWFASASPAYFATVGSPPEPGQDILAKAQRVRQPGGNCVTWVSPASYASPLGVPQSYDTGLWMQSVYTPDGNHIFALVHNEFHGELTAPPGHPSKYCTITQAFFLAGNACSYWNMAGAASTDGGHHFRLYKIGGLGADADYNAPVLASPHPYLLPADNAGNNPGLSGLLTVSNIIRWDGYYYVLVQQVPSAVPARQPPDGQQIGRNGTCIYRTDRLFDRTSWRGWNGTEYAVPTVTSYPSNITDPAQYTCTPVLNGYLSLLLELQFSAATFHRPRYRHKIWAEQDRGLRLYHRAAGARRQADRNQRRASVARDQLARSLERRSVPDRRGIPKPAGPAKSRHCQAPAPANGRQRRACAPAGRRRIPPGVATRTIPRTLVSSTAALIPMCISRCCIRSVRPTTTTTATWFARNSRWDRRPIRTPSSLRPTELRSRLKLPHDTPLARAASTEAEALRATARQRNLPFIT